MFNDIILTDIANIHVVRASKGRYARITDRPYYAISFCSDDGRIAYKMNNETAISDRYHAVILPKGRDYELINDEGGSFPIINFTALHDFTHEIISISLTAPEIYLEEFREMEEAYLRGDDNARVLSLFYSIISRLSKEETVKSSIARGAAEYIIKNISDPELSNSTIASACRVSEVYLRKIFKKAYHTTPKQYVIDMRIKRATQMLNDGISTISEVASSCGFASIYHFSRAYKQATGHMPSSIMPR